MEGTNGENHDLKSILTTEERDFLIRNNDDKLKVEDHVKGKIVGVYFSAHWCGPCRRFTPKLVDIYCELNAAEESKDGFQVVFVSGDEDEESFKSYFSEMPWLAVPFSDSATREQLNGLFKVRGIPHLVLLDGNTGNVINDDAVGMIRDYGARAYPFDSERLKVLKEEEEEEKRNQTLKSILTTPSRDYVISSDGNQVPVSELEGKMVGIYFSGSKYRPCMEFSPILAKMCTKLKERGDPFEVVVVSLDEKEEPFMEGLKGTPWLAVPFKDSTGEKLIRYFELQTLPTVVVIGPDGKTLNSNVAELVEEHGAEAYPFSEEKVKELAEIEKARKEAQTLESVLVQEELDYVISKNDTKVPVKELVGKTVLLYFSAHWCPPCRGFTPMLVDIYHKIKAKHSSDFEVIFVSSDRDKSSFDEYYSSMPWMALPFGDERKRSLSREFKVQGIPTLVALGPSGRTVTLDARGLVMAHGADAYPFTDDRIKELKEEMEEKAKCWPEKVKVDFHEHELVKKLKDVYGCDKCEEEGSGWSYFCDECDFDAHPRCALGDAVYDGVEAEQGSGKEEEKEESGKDGYVCDGDVCRKV